MNKVSIIAVVFGLISVNVCLSQSAPELKTLTPPSPNASSLGKYGEIPVSLYTGIPNISIPLHTVKSRSLELPISLSYHAGGIKVEEISSWVGLGWSLSSGGVITRSVRGQPDDIASGYFGTRSTMSTLAQKPIYLNYVGIPNDFTLETGNGSDTDLMALDQILSQTMDSESDIFHFNFGNYSGKFYMDSNGDFVSIPIQAMKIEYASGTIPSVPGATRWKVTMEDGVQYIFGSSLDGTRNAIERNDNGSLVTPNTAWYLLEVISPDNDRIDLYYTADVYNYQSKSSEVINTVVTDNQACTLPNFEKKIVTNYFQSVKLYRISGATGDVIFNPSAVQRVDLPGSYSLESMDIRNPQSAVIKKVKFSYSHFPSLGSCPTGVSYCKRLRLDKVETTSADGLTSGGKYQFGYNSQQLPSWDPNSSGANSINSQDIWGYFNGASNERLPRSGVINLGGGQTISVQGGLRHSSENSMKASVLTEIIYPTGGKSSFEYEANRLYTSDFALGGVNVEPLGKTASLVLVTNDVNKTSDFTVGIPYPSGGGAPAIVTVVLRQQVQNCPPSPAGVPNCYQVSIKGINGTVFNETYLLEGAQTLHLHQGDYRITGSTIPGYEATKSAFPKIYYVDVDWLETPSASPMAESNKIVGGLRIKSVSNSANGKVSVKKYLYTRLTDSNSSGVAVNLKTLSADAVVMTKWSNNVLYNCNYVQSKSTSLVPLVPTMGGVIGYTNVTELNGTNGEEGKTEYTYTTASDYPDENKNFRPFPPSCSFDWRRGLLLKKSVYRKDPSTYTKILEVENTYSFNNNTKSGYGVSVSVDRFGEEQTIGPNYYVAGYKTLSEFSYLATEKTRVFDQVNTSSFTETSKTYQYGIVPGHYQLTSVSSTDSQGQNTETVTKYPQDLTLAGPQETARQNLVTKFMLNTVLEQQLKQNAALLIKTTNDYTVFPNNLVLLSAINTQNGAGPLEKRITVTDYDNFGNALQQSKQDDVQHSYLWDYGSAYVIAEVKNAVSTDIAYTSFEAEGAGNWTLPSATRDLVNFRSGKKSYSLVNGAITKGGVALNKKYVLSFWAKTGASINVNGASLAPTSTPAVNNWQYYETEITGSASITSVSISGSGTLDELRWVPQGAQMTTYTMDPGIGITSITDPNNLITYYEYDAVGRLKLVRNDKAEIVKMSTYYYQLK